MSFFRNLYHSHQQLKERIHKTRIPLSPRGQKLMGFVYFCIPLIGGKVLYDWTMRKNQEKWHVDEKTGKLVVPKPVAEHKADLDRSKLHAQYILEAVKKEAERA